MPISTLKRVWDAGFVRRWHTNPDLSHTNDFISGHQQRCTVLLLTFWPDSSRESIIDCITHDQGEIAGADIPSPIKNDFPKLRRISEQIEDTELEEQGFSFLITDLEFKRRNFVDKLDSLLWGLKHDPESMKTERWHTLFSNLCESAEELDAVGFDELIEDVMGSSLVFFKDVI